MTRDGGRRILIVEDHELLAATLGVALEAEGWDVEIAPLAPPHDLVDRVAANPPGLVLLDLDLGPVLGDGIELVRPLCAAGAAVLVVSGVTQRPRLAAAVEAGAVGFVQKSQPFSTLLETVVRAAEGQPVLDASARRGLLAELNRHRRTETERLTPFQRLSERERQVLAALGNGKSVETIASEWFVSEATVRTQVRGVLTKLDVNSQLAAVAKARAAGWLSRV